MNFKTIGSLRGYAMLLVFVSHCGALFHSIGAWGGVAVSLFFVISGFLIGYRHGEDDVSKTPLLKAGFNYAKSKFSKFYVLYFIMLVIAIALQFAGMLGREITTPRSFGKLGIHLTLLQCLIPKARWVLSFNWPSWYLSTSMVICFCVPLLIKVCQWIREKHLTVAFIVATNAVNLAVCFAVMHKAVAYDMWYYLLYISPYVRIFHFAQAMLLGFHFKTHNKAENPHPIRATFLELLALLLFVGWVIASDPVPGSLVWGVSHLPAMFLVYVCAQAKGYCSKLLANKVMVKISAVSFEFYMIHRMVLVAAAYLNQHHLHWNGYLVGGISMAITLGLAFLYVAIDKKVRATWKKRKAITA